MKTKLLTGLLILNITFANAFGIEDIWHGIKHIHIHTMNKAEYTNRTLKKDTDFATVSIMRTTGRDFMILIRPKTKNILIKIQTENDNQIVSNLNDINLSKTYKVNCEYQGNLTYGCKTTDSDYNLVNYETFRLQNGRNYLTIQNPFSSKVKTIGWFDVTGDNLSFERK
jgi:hypothetical protein